MYWDWNQNRYNVLTLQIRIATVYLWAVQLGVEPWSFLLHKVSALSWPSPGSVAGITQPPAPYPEDSRVFFVANYPSIFSGGQPDWVIDGHTGQRESAWVSRRRLGFLECPLCGSLEGWMCVPSNECVLASGSGLMLLIRLTAVSLCGFVWRPEDSGQGQCRRF